MSGIIEKTSIVILIMLICPHIAHCGDDDGCDDEGCLWCGGSPDCTHCDNDYNLENGRCKKKSSGGSCFPGNSMVMTPAGNIDMETLNIGDSVLTVLDNEEMKFTKVVGFAQREPDKEARFLSITTVNQAGQGHTVKLSATHNIYTKTKMDDDQHEYIPRFAEDVSIGDVLKTQSDNGKAVNDATVTHVTLHKEMGVFAPLTETGTMLVDDTLVSCYASFNDYVAHLALVPIRWFPWMFADEEKPLNGRLAYVETVKHIARNYVAPIISLD